MSKAYILVVDDEKTVLDSIKTELKGEMGDEFIIETAESAQEAFEVFNDLIQNNHYVPVVISDYIMPDMKGDEFLKQLHKLAPKTLKIMLTGQADVQAVSNAVNYANLYRFITKPWIKVDLAMTIREAVHSYEKDDLLIKQNEEIRILNKDLERRVQERTKELVEANAAKDKFFSIISHDLKNPLSVLQMSSGLLLMSLDNLDPVEVRDLVERLSDGTKKLSKLLMDLLDWARTQTGNIPCHIEQQDLFPCVEETLSFLQQNADSKQISLLNDIEQNTFAYFDTNMVMTIIRNLVNNAVKFTNPKGTIKITALAKEGYLTISVIDDGIGMDDTTIENLFRIDVRHSHVGTAHETGTGLGLLICKEFATLNKGKLWAESKLGKGTTFFFTLPQTEIIY